MNENLVIVFFDGSCLMCNGAMRLLHRLDGGDVLRFAPLDGQTAEGMGIENGETMVVVKGGESFRKSEAVRVLLQEVFFLAGALLSLIPVAWRDWAYDFVAKRRQWFSKGVPVCGVPEEGMREKLLP